MNDIADWVKDIAQRKNRKARELRFYRGLDEQAPRWEEINKKSEFVTWLSERNDKTGKRIIDLILPAYEDYDDYTIACFYNYFTQSMVSQKKHIEGDNHKNSYKIDDVTCKKYQIFNVLGEGGFGIVYLAYSYEVNTIYALKTFRDEYLNDTQTRNRFRKEAQVWIDLERHPYLVSAYLIDEIAGRLFIAMEYIGPDEHGLNSLDAYFKHQPPDLTQSLRWAIQFCHGMEYAYSRGIRAHRDIKPANIMIAQNKTIKITDFGLAGIFKAGAASGQNIAAVKINNDAPMQTLIGTNMGTPEYMSPEHFADFIACDERSDLYSFGIVLYQMGSGGKLPFSSDNLKYRWAVLKHFHCEKDVPALNSPLFSMIRKCLEKDPARRYKSFAELRAVLEPLLKTQTGEVIAKPEGQEWEWWEWGIKGNSLGRLGRHEEALFYYDKSLKLWPDTNTLLAKGLCLSHLERFVEAIQCYDEAIRLDRNFLSAWTNKGFCCGKINRFDDAIGCYDEALRIDSRDVTTLNNKGSILSQAGRYDEAITCYTKLLAIDSAHIEAWFGKGFCFHMRNDFVEAIACYDKVLEIDTKYVLGWINKGKCFMGQRLMAEALDCYKRLLEMDQLNVAAWFDKALCEDCLGKKQDAVASFKQLISLAPVQLHKDIDYARKRLRELNEG